MTQLRAELRTIGLSLRCVRRTGYRLQARWRAQPL